MEDKCGYCRVIAEKEDCSECEHGASAPESGELFYVWIDADGKAITKAWSYKESIELDAEQESPPTGAFSLRTGDKKELQAMYGLNESDFVGESGEWSVNEWTNGALALQSSDFTHDVALEISGDFETKEQYRAYADMIAERLNS